MNTATITPISNDPVSVLGLGSSGRQAVSHHVAPLVSMPPRPVTAKRIVYGLNFLRAGGTPEVITTIHGEARTRDAELAKMLDQLLKVFGKSMPDFEDHAPDAMRFLADRNVQTPKTFEAVIVVPADGDTSRIAALERDNERLKAEAEMLAGKCRQMSLLVEDAKMALKTAREQMVRERDFQASKS
jgi:hypothetical protein